MNRRLRFNLQTRLSVHILVAIVVTVIGLSIFSFRELRTISDNTKSLTSQSFEARLEEQLAERGEVMSDYLVQNLTNALVLYDMETMRDLLQTTVSQQDVRFAYLFDSEGRIVHDGSPEAAFFGRNIDTILAWPLSAETAPATLVHGNVLHVLKAIRVGNRTLGGVAIGLALDPVSAEIGKLGASLDELTSESLENAWEFIIIVTLICILTGGLFAWFAGRRLARPILDLSAMALRVQEGVSEGMPEVFRNDEVGDLLKAFKSMSDGLKQSNNEVHYLAYRDPLTGLANRAQLKKSTEKMCANCAENGGKGAVLFIDLDDFKPVNDTLGHDAGDALLREVSERLKACLRSEPGSRWRFSGDESRSVARLGGDEFLLILEGIEEREDAARVASQILEDLQRPFKLHDLEVSIGASIGIATYPQDGRDGQSLIAHADVAMYSAKRAGKHEYRFYEETMYEQTRDRLFMISDLRRALDNDDFEVHYQPIMGGTSGRVVGVEALVRWRHRDRGLIKAAEFIEVAEQCGEIHRLGLYIFDRVCADVAGWRAQGIEGLFASVNISSRQLLREDLPDLLTGLLASRGLGPRDLRIEAEENRILSQLGAGISLLHQLNQAGFEIWVDQFGAGPASLLNLRQAPARGIKLSRQFVDDITTQARSRQFVKAIIDMANSVNLEVCAVGVSSEVQANWLRQHGCRYLQGDFMGPELRAQELPKFLDFQLHGHEQDWNTARLQSR